MVGSLMFVLKDPIDNALALIYVHGMASKACEYVSIGDTAGYILLISHSDKHRADVLQDMPVS